MPANLFNNRLAGTSPDSRGSKNRTRIDGFGDRIHMLIKSILTSIIFMFVTTLVTTLIYNLFLNNIKLKLL